jgi:hypothetical protein
MVFFNVPVPIPSLPRAVNMAVAMREAPGALIADWRERCREAGQITLAKNLPIPAFAIEHLAHPDAVCY